MNTHIHHRLHNHHHPPPPKQLQPKQFSPMSLQVWHVTNTTLWSHSLNCSNALCLFVCFILSFCYFERGSHEYWLSSNSQSSCYHLPSTGMTAVYHCLVYVAFFFKFILKYYFIYHFYLCISVSVNLCEYMPWVCLVTTDARREYWSYRSWRYRRLWTTMWCWELNIGPQQEFQALLAAEPLFVPSLN